MNKLQRLIFDITKEWNELENIMGENAALEVACQQEGKDSQWYYDHIASYDGQVAMDELRKFYDKKKEVEND